MTIKTVFLAGLLLTLGACATPLEHAAFPVLAEKGAPALLSELARVDALTPEQRRREVATLEGARRLDDPRRFQLAALLEREDSVEPLEHSLKVLNTLGEADARTQALLDLMKRSLKARIELRQQTARSQELQDMIDQIKALEKSLQQRKAPPVKP